MSKHKAKPLWPPDGCIDDDSNRVGRARHGCMCVAPVLDWEVCETAVEKAESKILTQSWKAQSCLLAYNSASNIIFLSFSIGANRSSKNGNLLNFYSTFFS